MLVAVIPMLACSAATAQAAGRSDSPYVPAADGIVLQRVPATTDPRVRKFDNLRNQVKREPKNRKLTLELARAYIAYARGTGDARYLGRALAVLGPWLNDKPIAVDVMVTHATILQSRHLFTAARRELRAALKRAPDNAQAWLTLSTVDMVQGRFEAARSDCVHTANTGGQYLAIICTGELLSLTGQAKKAYGLLSLNVGGGSVVPIDLKAYIQGLLATAAERMGKREIAAKHYQQALQYTPGDNFLLANYADLLLDQGQPEKVIALVRNFSASDTSFFRQVLAEAALKSPDTQADIQRMADRFAATDQRGSHVYRREQARFVLELQHQPKRALALAKQNWIVQRAPKDVRIFLETTLAANEPKAAQPVLEFLERSHMSTPHIDPLAAKVRAALAAPTQRPQEGR